MRLHLSHFEIPCIPSRINCPNNGQCLSCFKTAPDPSWPRGKEEKSQTGNNLSIEGWIGATDEITEGEFKWVTGETFSYTNWISGQPNNSGNEDYVAAGVGPGNPFPKWADFDDNQVVRQWVMKRFAERHPRCCSLHEEVWQTD